MISITITLDGQHHHNIETPEQLDQMARVMVLLAGSMLTQGMEEEVGDGEKDTGNNGAGPVKAGAKAAAGAKP